MTSPSRHKKKKKKPAFLNLTRWENCKTNETWTKKKKPAKWKRIRLSKASIESQRAEKERKLTKASAEDEETESNLKQTLQHATNLMKVQNKKWTQAHWLFYHEM